MSAHEFKGGTQHECIEEDYLRSDDERGWVGRSTSDRPTAAVAQDTGTEAMPARVLFALGKRDCTRACLRRVFDVARAFGGGIDVVRVLPGRLGWRWLPRPILLWLERRQKARALATLRATRYWLAGAYGAEPPAGHVVVRSGDFAREVAAHSATRRATVIIVPPDLERLGRVATRLALTSQQRVFVARSPGRSRTILAASDLVTLGYPVLQEAARLVTVLRMTLVSFHSFNPSSAQAEGEANTGRMTRPTDATEHLKQALFGLRAQGAAAVRTSIDISSSIVGEARDRQADLVVVGVRDRSRLERLIFGSVAAEVAKRANCSVLIAPLRGANRG